MIGAPFVYNSALRKFDLSTVFNLCVEIQTGLSITNDVMNPFLLGSDVSY